MPTVPTQNDVGFSPVGGLPGVQASPAAFGATVGQALQRGGAQIDDAVDQIQTRQRQISVNNQLNGFISDAHTITSGDPNNPNDTGYFGKNGQAAVDGRAGAFKSLNDAYTTRLNSLSDPLARSAFEADGRRYLNMTQGGMDQHFEQQSKAALVGSAQATSQLLLQGMAINYQNEPQWQANFQQGLAAKRNEVAAMGGTDAQLQAAQLDFTEQAKAQRVQAMITHGDLQGAQGYLQANAPDFKPATAEALNNMLTPKVRAQQASMAAGNALSAADQGYDQYLNSRSPTGQPTGPTVPALQHAILIQESSGNPTSPNPYQVQPAAFADNARPGENYNNPADKAAVGERMIEKYAQQYGGDPARVAVAFFSGPSNVAPAGSPTPWKTDAADGNGKSTSSYVSDVLGRLGGTSGIQTKADYYKANYADIIDKTRQDALSQHSDDPQFADLAVARTEQQMSAVIRQQELGYASDRDTVLRAVNGDLAKGIHPTSIDELSGMGQTVGDAWSRIQQNQPEVAHEIATRLLTENAKTQGHDASTYGPAFISVFDRIHAADGDPNRITDPAQLYTMVGNGLTMDGLTKAREELVGKSTPDGDAEAHMRAQLFKTAHSELSGSDDGMGLKDPKGEEIYLRWMAGAYKQISAGKNAGQTAAQLYDPASPDYVGKSITPMKRTLAQRTADMTGANADAVGASPGPVDLSTPESIKSAYAAGRLSRLDAIKAMVGKTAALPPAQTE